VCDCLSKAEEFLCRNAGASATERVRTLRSLYGADRTFAVPILANCALAAGQRGSGMPAEIRVDWADVSSLPFELAWLPRAWFRRLRLHVVSYALPALIAIGQMIHNKRPTRHWLWRRLRDAAIGPTLRRLETIQPESGGFLEATPLTSFVVMSLAAAGRADHPVTRRGMEFIQRSVRPDGSWPIDTNLSNWVTTLAVSALTAGGSLPGRMLRRQGGGYRAGNTGSSIPTPMRLQAPGAGVTFPGLYLTPMILPALCWR